MQSKQLFEENGKNTLKQKKYCILSVIAIAMPTSSVRTENVHDFLLKIFLEVTNVHTSFSANGNDTHVLCAIKSQLNGWNTLIHVEIILLRSLLPSTNCTNTSQIIYTWVVWCVCVCLIFFIPIYIQCFAHLFFVLCYSFFALSHTIFHIIFSVDDETNFCMSWVWSFIFTSFLNNVSIYLSCILLRMNLSP